MKIWKFILIFLLTGCGYSNGCWHFIAVMHCEDMGKGFPYIAYFQKPHSIGKTDSAQRWNDAYGCGGVVENKGEGKDKDIFVIGERNKDRTLNVEVVKKFESCMKSKGYIKFKTGECGTQKPKWNTGKCNI